MGIKPKLRNKNIDGALIEYIELVDGKTLQTIQKLEGDVLIALAVKFGKTRLIDNIDFQL